MKSRWSKFSQMQGRLKRSRSWDSGWPAPLAHRSPPTAPLLRPVAIGSTCSRPPSGLAGFRLPRWPPPPPHPGLPLHRCLAPGPRQLWARVFGNRGCYTQSLRKLRQETGPPLLPSFPNLLCSPSQLPWLLAAPLISPDRSPYPLPHPVADLVHQP